MERPLTEHMKADGTALSLREYEQAGGYEGLRKALRTLTPKDVLTLVKESNLRGRGGAPSSRRGSHSRGNRSPRGCGGTAPTTSELF